METVFDSVCDEISGDIKIWVEDIEDKHDEDKSDFNYQRKTKKARIKGDP